jgi:hypothetical protein
MVLSAQPCKIGGTNGEFEGFAARPLCYMLRKSQFRFWRPDAREIVEWLLTVDTRDYRSN